MFFSMWSSPAPSPPTCTSTAASSYQTTTSSSSTSSSMDIPFGQGSSARQPSFSCAYPSWPRRSSLSASHDDDESPATSYISDDDLFLCVFDEAEQDSLPTTPHSVSPALTTQQVVDPSAFLRDLMIEAQAEKQIRRETRRRRKQSGSRKSSRSSGTTSKPMTPIMETGE